MIRRALLFISLILLTACMPDRLSESAIYTAIAGTMTAQPPGTPVPPQDTPSPVLESSVRFDDWMHLLLQPSDLPDEASYTPIESGASDHVDNSQILTIWGAEKGQEYIDQTGRLDGWWVQYGRKSQNVPDPETVYCGVILFKTPEGADLALQWLPPGQEDYVEVSDVDLGLRNLKTGYWMKKTTAGETGHVWHRIGFAYRNYLAILILEGSQNSIQPEFVAGAAQNMLARLQSYANVEP